MKIYKLFAMPSMRLKSQPASRPESEKEREGLVVARLLFSLCSTRACHGHVTGIRLHTHPKKSSTGNCNVIDGWK